MLGFSQQLQKTCKNSNVLDTLPELDISQALFFQILTTLISKQSWRWFTNYLAFSQCLNINNYLIRFYNLKLQNRFYTSTPLNWVKRERLSPKERPFPTIKITQLLARDRQFREHLRFKAEYSYVNWDQFCFARTSWIHPNFYSLTLYSLDSIHCAIYVVYNNVYVCM